MKSSKRADSILPSLTRKLFNEASKYDDVIDLTLGDPDFDTPNAIKQSAITAIKSNKTHYSANAGVPAAREAIARHVTQVWGVPCNESRNIILTVGGMEALYLSLLALVDEGDEVMILAPYYVNYLQMIQMCGGKPVVIDAYDSCSGLVVDRDALEERVTDKTVAIIINSPSNPTGAVLSKGELKAVSDFAAEHDLAVISDEVYRTLLYDGCQHESILQFEKARSRTILIDSASKQFSMTGWRIGYAYGPEDVITNMVKLQENVAACANVPSQYALAAAYSQGVDTSYMVREFQARRDYLCEALQKQEGLKFRKPEGTFYLFADISAFGLGSEEFCYKLLQSQHVAVVPGKAYGEKYDGYIRIAFTKDIPVLTEAARRMIDFLDGLKG